MRELFVWTNGDGILVTPRDQTGEHKKKRVILSGMRVGDLNPEQLAALVGLVFLQPGVFRGGALFLDGPHCVKTDEIREMSRLEPGSSTGEDALILFDPPDRLSIRPMTTKLTPARLLAALADTEYEPRPYSGRGMYGKSCVGVVVESLGDAFLLGARLALELGEEPPVPSSDSLGRGLIVYWRTIEMEEIGDEESESEGSEEATG